MKKYIQISIVFIVFGLLVLARQIHGNDERPAIGNPANPSSSNTTNSINSPTQAAQETSPTPTTGSASSKYKDGSYTGSVADAYYGNIQVKAVISGGKITDVIFLQYPNDNGTSQFVNSQAMPLLKSEAIAAQSAQVDIISGASSTSQAFQQSFSSALQQAI